MTIQLAETWGSNKNRNQMYHWLTFKTGSSQISLSDRLDEDLDWTFSVSLSFSLFLWSFQRLSWLKKILWDLLLIIFDCVPLRGVAIRWLIWFSHLFLNGEFSADAPSRLLWTKTTQTTAQSGCSKILQRRSNETVGFPWKWPFNPVTAFLPY